MTHATYGMVYLIEEPSFLKWTDLKVGDIIQRGTLTSMVVLIDSDPDSQYHIYAGCQWLPEDTLKMYQKVN